MEFRYSDGKETRSVTIVERADGYEVEIGDNRYQVRATRVDGSTLDLWIDGRYRRARHAENGEERWVSLDGTVSQLRYERHRSRKRVSGEGDDTLTATMPGQIVAVLAAPGDAVERGQALVIMEAMKMELRVAAPHDGTVARVLVREGEAVERGQTLVELKGSESGG